MPIVDNCKGYTVTTGNGGVFTVSGAPAAVRSITATLANNYETEFYIQSATQFEHFWGRYNTSGTTITVLTRYSTSQGGTTPTNWTTGQKLISCVATSVSINDMENKVDGATKKFLSATNKLKLDAIPKIQDRFWYKPNATTPIFLLVTGQSNPDGVEGPMTVPYPSNSNVFILQPKDRAVVPQQLNCDFTASGYQWENVNPSQALIGPSVTYAVPNVGWYGAQRGNIGISCAYELQAYYGRPVYLLNMCISGAEIEFWINIESPAGNTVHTRLAQFVAFLCANTPEFSSNGITFPDLIIWGQSESNAGAKGAALLSPLAYKDKWNSVRQASFGTWSNEYLTDWYLMEATQYALETGTGGAGGPNDAIAYPWKWEGLNAVVRYNNEKVTLVSSKGIPWQITGGGAFVHFTPDGIKEYGKAIARAMIGKTISSRVPNTEVVRDRTPSLGGPLLGAGNPITGLSYLALDGDGGTSAAITSARAATLSWTSNQTFDFSTLTLPTFFHMAGTKTLKQSAAAFMGFGFLLTPTFKNFASTAASPGSFNSIYSSPTFQADAATLLHTVDLDISSAVGVSSINSGVYTLLSCTNFSAGSSATVVGAGTATITNRYAYLATGPTLTGVGATVINNVGFLSYVGGATHNTHFMMSTTSTLPPGQWGIYQNDTVPHQLNATLTMALGNINLTAGNITLTAGGVTAAAGLISSKTLTVIDNRSTITAIPTTARSVKFSSAIQHNYAASFLDQQFAMVEIANVHTWQSAPWALGTAVGLLINDTVTNLVGSATTGLTYAGSLKTALNVIANTNNITTGLIGDIVSAPVLSAVSNANLTITALIHFTASGSISTLATLTGRTCYSARNFTVPVTVPAGSAVTSQIGFFSGLTSAGATSSTHYMMGSAATTGNWGIYQDDTFIHKTNAPTVRKVNEFGSTTVVTITFGMDIVILQNGSSGALTLPTKANMTAQGYTAAQLKGYTVKIVNDRTGTVTVNTDADCDRGWASTCDIAAKSSRDFVWGGLVGAQGLWY